MSNVESQIIKLLQTAVITAVNGVFPLKPLNVNIEPPAAGKWWEIVYIPNNRENEFWSDEQTYTGILRLVLHWPQDNTGIYTAMNEAVRVADALPKGSLFQSTSGLKVRIVDNPNISNVIEESPNLIIPLTLRYQCFTI